MDLARLFLQCSFFGIAAAVALFSPAAGLAFDIYTELPPGLVGYDSRGEIHIHSAADADAVRRDVIDYLWGSSGVPAALPAGTTVYSGSGALPADLVGLNRVNIAGAERLTADMDYNYSTRMYLLHPVNTKNAQRLAIVSHGHAGYGDRFNAGVGTLTDHLLKNGFTVLSMEMPLYGWNRNGFYNAPGHPGWWTPADHNAFVDTLEGANGKSALRFFIEPVIQGINKFVQLNPHYTDISMFGLSGGGWTTVLSAAVDPRIKTSVPVAGSMPIYARSHYPGSMGDREQTISALYGRRAGYLDLYVLGAYGAGRKQIQVNNQYDSCCFYGVSHTTWVNNVKGAVASTGAGIYDYYLDTLPHSHQISSNAIYKVIDPALGIAPPTSPPSISEQFSDPGTPPPGWFYGSSNQGSPTIAGSGGAVTFSGGCGMAAIFFNKTMDPRQPTTATMKINSVSSGADLGMFFTDNPNLRDHLFGLQIRNGSLYLGSDNGGNYTNQLLTALSGYSGGPVTLTLSWDAAGCTVSTDVGHYSRRLDFPLANNFRLGDLGGDVYLFIQRSSGSGAAASVDYVTVTAIHKPKHAGSLVPRRGGVGRQDLVETKVLKRGEE
jgi:hypothetical protein